MESGMDMVYGQIKIKQKYIQDVIAWIKSKAMEYMSGLVSKCTKGNFVKIFDKDLEDFIK